MAIDNILKIAMPTKSSTRVKPLFVIFSFFPAISSRFRIEWDPFPKNIIGTSMPTMSCHKISRSTPVAAAVVAVDYTWVAGNVKRDAHVLSGRVSQMNLAGVVIDGDPSAIVTT